MMFRTHMMTSNLNETYAYRIRERTNKTRKHAHTNTHAIRLTRFGECAYDLWGIVCMYSCDGICRVIESFAEYRNGVAIGLGVKQMRCDVFA